MEKLPEPKNLKNRIRFVSKDLSKNFNGFCGRVLGDRYIKAFIITILLFSLFSNAHIHASPYRNVLDQKFEKAQGIDENVESEPKEKADTWWTFINFLTMRVDVENITTNTIYEYKLFKFAEKRFEYWKAHSEIKEVALNDAKNGLQWVIGPDADIGWNEACVWVKNLSFDGGGWRMPTCRELLGLFSFGHLTERNIPDSYETTGWFIWSGEKKAPIYAFFIDLGTGIIESESRGTFRDFRAFAVRNSIKD